MLSMLKNRVTAIRALAFYAILGTSLVFGRPLGYKASNIVDSRGCATVITERDRIELENGLSQTRRRSVLEARELVNSTKRSPKHVAFDVYWHVLYANETYAGGFVPDSQIMEQMKVLNEDYKSVNISWNFMNITRIPNEDWFVNAWPGSPQEEEMKRMYHKGNSRALNIFTSGFNATDKSLGYSSLPSAYFREPLKDGLIIRYSTLPGGSHTNYNLGRTTVHELGHWLGLFHTFEGGCAGVGDNVDDTPPESSGAEGCPVGRKSCPDSKDLDPIHNFMDYSFDSCMTHFTPGQAIRMHEAIWAFRTPRPPVANSTITSMAIGAGPTSATTTSNIPMTPSPTDSGTPIPDHDIATDMAGEEETLLSDVPTAHGADGFLDDVEVGLGTGDDADASHEG